MAAKPPPDGEKALPHLHLHSEKLLLSPIQPHLLSYCPTMDLIALVTAEQNLDVYRINGQKAFSLKRKSDDDVIDALCWQYNGRNIAVSWSDGSTDIVSAESGKVVHGNLRVGAGDERVVRMGWGVNFIETDGVKRRTGVKKRKGREKQGTESTPAKKKETDNDTSIDFIGKETTEDWDAFKDDVTLEDFLQRQPDLQYLEIAPDLPDQLAMMDMETLLPKLPAIPMPPALPFMRAPQAASGAFSSQIEVDSLLHSHHLKDHNSVDMFIRCTDKGTVHPSIYDSLETINVELPSAWNIQSTPILHTSHPYSCHHGLVLQTTNPASPDDHKLSFVPLKLNFIPSAGIYLHLIASKTSQLQNLLLYITQTLQRIHTFWKHSQDLPSKFMMNISETLEEKGQGDLVSNLFHLACTGNCTPVLREWLVDELAEQGHKRWDNAVTSGLTTLLSLVHENFLPALDRCSIVISRLRGLAQFHDQSWIFNGPITDFTMLLELLKNLRLLGHTVLLYASDEKKQFLSFSKWLRFCIDFEATEPGSQSRAEMEGRDPGVDIGMVLEYIQYPLTKSDLTPHLRPSAQLSGHQKVKEPASYDDTKKAIELLKEGAHYKEEALCLEHVLKHFEHGVTKLLKQVGQWQQTNSSMDCGIVLEEGDIDNATVDMRMVFEESSNPNDITTYIAISPQSSSSSSSESSSHLYIHRFTHEPTISTLPKDLTTYATTTLDFAPCDAKILDVKFADDKSLLILLHLSSSSSSSSPNASTHPYALVSLPYTPISTTISYHSPSTTHFIPYNPIPTSAQSTALLPSGTPVTPSIRTTLPITPTLLQKHTRHIFEARFAPLKMIVNGRKGRRVVVVLGKDRKCFRVLDMDFKGRKKDRGGEGNGEEGENEGEEDEESSSDSEEEGKGFGDGDVEMGGA